MALLRVTGVHGGSGQAAQRARGGAARCRGMAAPTAVVRFQLFYFFITPLTAAAGRAAAAGHAPEQHGPRKGARKSAFAQVRTRYRTTPQSTRASMRAAGAGGEDGSSSALLLCAAGDGVGPAALRSLPRRAQLLVNAPEGVSRLALEHRVRPTGRLAALLLTSLSPDAAVRCATRITKAHV